MAQVNTERLRADVRGTSASVEGSVAIKTGNSDLVDTAAALRIDHRDSLNYVFLAGRLSYGTNNNTTYSNSSFAHLRYNRTLTEGLTAEAFGQLERDGFTLLQLRALVGAGLRARWASGEAFSIVQGSAIMYERERLDASKVTVHPARVSHARWSNYVSFSIAITPTATLSATTYVQPAMEDFGDIRIINDSVLDVKLGDRFSLTTALTVRYDSRPPDGIESTDVAIRNGLRFRISS